MIGNPRLQLDQPVSISSLMEMVLGMEAALPLGDRDSDTTFYILMGMPNLRLTISTNALGQLTLGRLAHHSALINR
jgi:hypothetical protein